MRRMSIVGRADLKPESALKKVKDVSITDIHIITPQRAVADADIIIFYCSLLNKYKFLKNRNGKLGTEESLDLPEDENALLSILLGIL